MSKDLSTKYSEDNKERLLKRSKTISKEGKKIISKDEKKRQYCRKWYKILPEDENQKLVEYRKKYIKWEKMAH